MSRTITNSAEDILHAGYNNRNQNVCALCLSIPFDKLPAEGEAAYPHHFSLATLEASARSCPLCALILQSIDEEKQRLKDEQPRSGILMGDFAWTLGRTAKNPVNAFVESLNRWQIFRRDPGGKALEVQDLGRYNPATYVDVELARYGVIVASGAKRPPSPPPPLSTVPGHHNHKSYTRPWLYGNWWLLDQPDESRGKVTQDDFNKMQLIGVGVRLTEMPVPHPCKTYDRDVIHLRGSSLRVFTDEGRCLSLHE